MSLEIAWAQRVIRTEPPDTWPPLRAEDLTVDARARLLERAEARAHRVRLRHSRSGRDWFWIAAELALVLPRVHPKVVRRWRERLKYRLWHAEFDLEKLRKLEALILQYEPETDAWLRRQLADLSQRPSA